MINFKWAVNSAEKREIGSRIERRILRIKNLAAIDKKHNQFTKLLKNNDWEGIRKLEGIN